MARRQSPTRRGISSPITSSRTCGLTAWAEERKAEPPHLEGRPGLQGEGSTRSVDLYFWNPPVLGNSLLKKQIPLAGSPVMSADHFSMWHPWSYRLLMPEGVGWAFGSQTELLVQVTEGLMACAVYWQTSAPT